MPECSKCETRIHTGSLCDMCRVERTHAGVDHSPDDTEQPACSVCGDPGGEADHDGRAGLWLCPGCQTLPLTPRQRDQLVAATPDALNGAVRWAVGDDSAYPDEDPAQIEAGFETASQRLIADGGDMVECCPFEDCRSARFRVNSLTPVGVQADEKYRCKDCDRPFDEPDERERRQHGETRQGLARKLADPEVSEPADLRADGGFHTVTREGQEYAVVRWQEFDEDADLDIAPDGAIENYDEVGKHTSIRLISADAIREQGMQERVIGPDDRHWREEYADLEPGEEVRPEEVDG